MEKLFSGCTTTPKVEEVFPIGTEEEKKLLELLKEEHFDSMFINWLPPPLLKRFLDYFQHSNYSTFLEGLKYEYGLLGVTKDLNKALNLYIEGAYGDKDYFCMYRYYLIHLRESEKFNIKRDRILEKFFLFKTLCYTQFDILSYSRYFRTKMDLVKEIRSHLEIEDRNLEKFPKMFKILRENKEYNIPPQIIDFVEGIIRKRFTNNPSTYTDKFISMNESEFDSYEPEIIYKMAYFNKSIEGLPKKYYEYLEKKNFYKCYADYGEYLFDQNNHPKALELFEIGYKNYEDFCLYDYYDLYLYHFDFDKFKEEPKEKRFEIMTKLLDLLLLDFSYGGIYSLFDFLYLRRLCWKLFDIGELIDQKFKEEIQCLIPFLKEMITTKEDINKCVFHKNTGLAECSLDLAFIYYTGIEGIVSVDLDESLALFKKAFKLGTTKNYCRFAYSFIFKIRRKLFKENKITKEKYEKTQKKLFRLYKNNFEEDDYATESSSSFLYYLAVMYYKGIGVKSDLINAYVFYEKATKITAKTLGCGSVVAYYRKYKSDLMLKTNKDFENIMNSLNKLKITDDEGYGEDNSLCCVCFVEKRDKVLIPCRHSFCSKCIEYIQKEKLKCPICRGKITKIGNCEREEGK